MKTLGYYNGKCGEIEEMTVPMNDRAGWFGDGVYDAQPCRNYHLFATDEHLDRFYRSAAALDIRIPLDKKEMKALLESLVHKLDTGNLFVYYQVTRGTGMRAHVFPDGPSNLWITMVPEEILDGLTPIRLITVEDTRYFHCDIKTLNLIPNVMASEAAKRAGCQEAVFIRQENRVTECAHSNIHILKDGTLRTAPLDKLILPGTARAHLIAACRALGILVDETPFTKEELFDADEIIVTNCTDLCLRAEMIDGKPAGCRDYEHFEMLRRYLVEEYMRATQ